MFAKENKREGEVRSGRDPEPRTPPLRIMIPVPTSAPSFVSVYRYSLLFSSSLTAYTYIIQFN